MRIMQIVPQLEIGGVERGTVDLAGELIQRGHSALVISGGGRMVKELESAGARHIQLSVHKKSLFSILSNIPKVAKIMEEEKVDIVHARSRVPALIAFLAARRTGTNFITTAHGYYSHNFFSQVMGWGKFVIVSSFAIAQHMIEDFAVPRERLRFIPRGVDLQRFQFSLKADGFTIGVVGRLTPIKGHKYFLQALSKVIRNFPRVKALIIGEGKEDYKEELKMLARRLSLDRYVEFLGARDNLPQLYSRLNVLVLPTVTQEAFGRVLIEAGASGVPVIATRVGGIVDIVQDGENGILVEPKDPSGLASAITKILQQPKLARRMARAARKQVEEKFTLEKMTERTIRVYQETQELLKILVIKMSALGDVILAIPSLRALRNKFPSAQITVLVAEPFQAILQNCPYVNQVLQVPLANKGLTDICRQGSLLRKLNFDLVVDLQNNRQSHLLAYLSAASRRYGYANGKWSFLLNRKAKQARLPVSPIQHQARTLKLLGAESIEEGLELWFKPADESWADDFLKNQNRDRTAALIGVNIGASLRWPSKRWNMEKLAILLGKIQDAGMQVLITGRKVDLALVRKISQLTNVKFINAVGQTELLQLAALIKRCNVYLTSDSAPLHIAYAVHTPVVALFGPTDPRRHVIADAKLKVIYKGLVCAPCYKRRCRRHDCMEQIQPDEVFETVRSFLR